MSNLNPSSTASSQNRPTTSAGPSTPAPTGSGAPGAPLAGQNASTPRSNPLPSPASHRSPADVRSPAAVRSVGGTPMQRAASSNLGGSTVGSAPMQRGHTVGAPGAKDAKGRSGVAAKSIQGGVTDSPTINPASPAVSSTPGAGSLNALAGFESPATNGSMIGNLPGLAGGVDMLPSLSGMGFSLAPDLSATGSTSRRIDDGERRRRLEAVLDTLRARPGRISREAIDRLGRRCEMDVMPEGNNQLLMAGKNAVMIEIEFKPRTSSTVERVNVAFPTASDAMSQHAEKASKILQEDLTPPPTASPINATLDKFANNLERLARMDKLSVPGANCFEAVFGVYSSLKRLYEQEKKASEHFLADDGGNKRLKRSPETWTLCKKSGRPRMNARRRVGLSLDYWKKEQFLPQMSSQTDPEAMDVDDSKHDDLEEQDDQRLLQSIAIECESCPPALYPTIRVTDGWISERVEKPQSEENGEIEKIATEDPIEWLDPPPSLIPPADPNVGNADAAAHPKARFIARFEPPLVLPPQAAIEVYQAVEVNGAQENISPRPMEELLIPGSQAEKSDPGEPRQIHTSRTITSIDEDGNPEEHEYDLRLFLPRAEYAYQIDRLPFSHPRQIVSLLPLLRQYACTNALIRNTFSQNSIPQRNVHDLKQESQDGFTAEDEVNESTLADFLAEPSSTNRTLDVAFSTVPSPHLTINMANGIETKSATISILSNGDLELLEQNFTDVSDGNSNEAPEGNIKESLIEALMICEDLGTFAEWVQKRYLANT